MSLTLADLPIGARARVTKLTDADLAYTQQLSRLGLIKGTIIEVIRRAPLGDPVEIRFRGFSLAIRPDEATSLELEQLAGPDV